MRYIFGLFVFMERFSSELIFGLGLFIVFWEFGFDFCGCFRMGLLVVCGGCGECDLDMVNVRELCFECLFFFYI